MFGRLPSPAAAGEPTTRPTPATFGLRPTRSILLRPQAILAQFPPRSRLWIAIISLAFVAITAMLLTTPTVALQYWFLYNTPLFIAAFVFGLRGALVSAIVTIISLTILYFSSEALSMQLAAGLETLVDLGTGSLSELGAASPSGAGESARAVAGRFSTLLSANDPRATAARAGAGLLSLIITNIFFGLLTDRARVQEASALERASNQLKRYFSPQLVNAIVKGDRSMGLATVRKEITVVFADLRGFTILTERLEPEELGLMLNQYLTEMTEVIFKFDGTLDKYIGDAVMAFFGDPVSHGDDPERAVRAAVEMRERFHRLRSSWATEGREAVHVGIGVNTGFATVGNVGSPVRMEYTVIGSAVNTGARLADAAKPGQILTSQRTLSAVRHLVEWRSVGQLELHGVQYPVDAVEVMGLRRLAQHEEIQQVNPFELVLAQAAEDPIFRVALTKEPDLALKPYRLEPDEQVLARDVASFMGYPVFRGVSGPALVEFIRLAVVEQYSRGTVLFRQGDPPDRFYLIAQGEVATYKTDARGREVHTATLGRGSHFGELGLLDEEPRNLTVYTTTDVELLSLSATSFKALEQVAPALMQNIMVESSRREFATSTSAHLPV